MESSNTAFSVLQSAGPMPLRELNLRASGTPSEILEELQVLVQEGLVEVVNGRLPDAPDELSNEKSEVRLTRTGTRRALRAIA